MYRPVLNRHFLEQVDLCSTKWLKAGWSCFEWLKVYKAVLDTVAWLSFHFSNMCRWEHCQLIACCGSACGRHSANCGNGHSTSNWVELLLAVVLPILYVVRKSHDMPRFPRRRGCKLGTSCGLVRSYPRRIVSRPDSAKLNELYGTSENLPLSLRLVSRRSNAW